MKERRISESIIRQFQAKMTEEEKSSATKEKYIRDVKAFAAFCKETALKKKTSSHISKNCSMTDMP